MNFLDPLRALNYLLGETRFDWVLASNEGGALRASNAVTVDTVSLSALDQDRFDAVVVSASWTPERYADDALSAALRRWARRGLTLGAIDTGAFVLAGAGLLKGRTATVHYEHLDAFAELFPDTRASEQLCVFDGDRISCCGGSAAVDFGLHLIAAVLGDGRAKQVARYLYAPGPRPLDTPQSPERADPQHPDVPAAVRQAIALMEAHLETPIALRELCSQVGISQRQLARLFERYVGKTPVRYYRDIRLDRARGLVTQTVLPLSQVAVASGFGSVVHFSRAYRERFGLPPGRDRVEGRVPFEFRAWPMHRV